MNVDYKYLRPEKAAFIQTIHREAATHTTPLRMERVVNATIIPPELGDKHPCVYDASGHPCTLATEHYDFDPPTAIPPETKRAERVLYAGYLNPHWGHFIMDSLSQLWPAFLDETPDFDAIVYMVHPSEKQSLGANIKETLQLTGMGNKIIILSEPTQFREVIIPERAVNPETYAKREALAVYDAVGRNAEQKCKVTESADLLFMSRANLPKAQYNEPGAEWVDYFFKDNGFCIIHPEQQSAAQTIAMIRRAETVAAMSGTLPHNCVFARPRTNLIIFEKGATTNRYQPLLDVAKGLKTTYVDCNALIHSVSAGLGPFILYPNHLLYSFCADGDYEAPREWSDSKKREVLAAYFKIYRRNYSRQWILASWEEPEIRPMREAYEDSMRDFGSWIRGERPVTLFDYISPRQVLKRIFKG